MPADMTVTRQTVYDWIEEWNDSGKSETLEEWVRRHVKELRLPDTMVNTVGHDTLDDVTSLDDLIVADLPSYANATDSAT